MDYIKALANIERGVVLGCPRSGTTYLMHLLNTLPDTESVVGTLIPIAVPHIVNQELSPEVRQALETSFERSLHEYLQSGRYRSRVAAVQKWLSAPTGIAGLVKALRGVRSLRRIVYKEPFLSLAPEFVYHAAPEAQIIHICRDGRDSANSLVESYDVLTDEELMHLRSAEMPIGRPYDHRYVPWWVEEGRDEEFIRSTPYVRSIWMWKVMVRRCHDFFSRPDVQASGRVMMLRYEDLMHDPVTCGEAVLEHLGADPSPGFYRMLKRAHRGSIGKYRHRDPEEIQAAEQLAGEELELYGYSVTGTLAPA